jgi:tetratricopeptide (TPR) repeat protein
MAVSASLLAQNACAKKDWGGAAKLCARSHKAAVRLKEPRKSLVESQVEMQWACVLHRQGKIREAEDLFRRGYAKAGAAGCKESPVFTHAHLTWGDLCADEGRLPEAEQHYQISLDGEERIGNRAAMIFALQLLGDTLMRQGRKAEAEEAINRAIALETQVVHEADGPGR